MRTFQLRLKSPAPVFNQMLQFFILTGIKLVFLFYMQYVEYSSEVIHAMKFLTCKSVFLQKIFSGKISESHI